MKYRERRDRRKQREKQKQRRRRRRTALAPERGREVERERDREREGEKRKILPKERRISASQRLRELSSFLRDVLREVRLLMYPTSIPHRYPTLNSMPLWPLAASCYYLGYCAPTSTSKQEPPGGRPHNVLSVARRIVMRRWPSQKWLRFS